MRLNTLYKVSSFHIGGSLFYHGNLYGSSTHFAGVPALQSKNAVFNSDATQGASTNVVLNTGATQETSDNMVFNTNSLR